MKMHSCWNFVLNTLGVILIVVCICRAQSAQSSSVSLPAGGAKPLLLEKNEGELRVRRAVSDAPSQSGTKPADPVPFILKVSPKNNGSEHLVLITEDLPPGGSIAKHSIDPGGNCARLVRRRGARSSCGRTCIHSHEHLDRLEEHRHGA
jgi:hypothetical protein